MLKKPTLALGVFFLTFGVYLYTAGPTVVPFRDAGEMTTTTALLGVLHPPSYPLYTIAGHLAAQLPFANPGYRLNLFSALCMSAAWTIFTLLIVELTASMGAAFIAALIGAFSYQFWAHALVSEMYALNILLVVAVFWSAAMRRWLLAAFLCGLACANRLDFVLCLPSALILFYAAWKKDRRMLLWSAAFSLAGLLLYLYLPLRAATRPLLNWNDPSTIDQFISSVMRRGYGSGLDLLSHSYATGVNFWPELVLYGKHLMGDYYGVLVLLSLLGFIGLWKRDRRWFASLVAGFVITGPLFIFLGNLPANPHAVAIMESAYLVPDLFLLVAAGVGLAELLRYAGAQGARLVLVVAGVLVFVECGQTAAKVSRRERYLAADFVRNVYHSTPPGSLVIARSDVPVFSLFYGHYIYPAPTDRFPLAQGLAGSFWYQAMLGRELHHSLQLPESLKDLRGWNELAHNPANGAWQVFATFDSEWPTPLPQTESWGPLSRLKGSGVFHPVPALPTTFLTDLCVYRGRYRYDAYPDFFSSELIEEYAKAWMARGGSDDAYWHALALKPDMPYAAEQLAYGAFTRREMTDAARYYRWTATLFRRTLDQARLWNSLPPAVHAIRVDFAAALAQAGVVEERLGHSDLAKVRYESALEQDPECPDAHYNLAVIYWKKGAWPSVVEHLQTLARSHPEDKRWQTYLPIALAHLR